MSSRQSMRTTLLVLKEESAFPIQSFAWGIGPN